VLAKEPGIEVKDTLPGLAIDPMKTSKELEQIRKYLLLLQFTVP